MKIMILFIFLISQVVYASDIPELFKKKNYQQIAKYFDNEETFKTLSPKDMFTVSYSLRVLGRHRDNTRLIVAMVKKLYAKEHFKIYDNIQKKVTLDAEDYPKPLLLLYWNMYNEYASIIKSYSKKDPQLEKDKSNFQTFRLILSELEFREGKVEKTNDQVTSHLQYLNDIEYRLRTGLQLQYISWQYSAVMFRKSTGAKTDLIITNQGMCLGGDAGYESGFYSYAVEGCFLIGSGGVTAYGTPEVTYKQNLVAYGLKIGPSAYKIVSTSKSRIGISLPILLTSQKMTQPSDTDYVVEQNTAFNVVPTLNARWQFDNWYLKTEFGQYIGKKEILWGLGVGRQF